MKKTNQSIKPNQELEIIKQDVGPLAERATSFSIKSDKDMKQAVTILSQLNQFNDRIITEREKVTKPLNEALKAERARWKPTELQNTIAIDSIRAEMSRYQTEITNQKKADEQKIANKLSTGYIKLETAVTKIESLPTVEKTTSTDEGSVTFVETKILKVTDLQQIPEEYWMINEKELLQDLKKGIVISGAELDTIQTPRNIR